MLKNPYIKAAIKSKNTAPVFDFIADDKKNVNSACIVIDRVVDGENEAAFIENLCAMAQNEAGMNMRFENKVEKLPCFQIEFDAAADLLFAYKINTVVSTEL